MKIFSRPFTRPLTTIACNGLDVSQIPLFAQYGPRIARTNANPFQLFDAQFQQATRVGRHQLIVGHQRYTMNKSENCSETFSFDLLTDTFDGTLNNDGRDQGSQTYVRDEIQVTPWLHATAGVAYQELDLHRLRRRAESARAHAVEPTSGPGGATRPDHAAARRDVQAAAPEPGGVERGTSDRGGFRRGPQRVSDGASPGTQRLFRALGRTHFRRAPRLRPGHRSASSSGQSRRATSFRKRMPEARASAPT